MNIIATCLSVIGGLVVFAAFVGLIGLALMMWEVHNMKRNEERRWQQERALRMRAFIKDDDTTKIMPPGEMK
jgi:hypothetical protein